ncbi:MAG: class I SAM-dependent methyltransferase [Halobacteriota archaeon]
MEHPAQDFFDEIAELYDPAHRGRDIGDESFYRELAMSADGPVLEVGCGTGRIYLELLRAGVDADGFDVSTRMLERLEAKAAAEDLEPFVWRDDMREFEAPREYDLLIVPFRTFLHNVTLRDQISSLERFRAALAPGGRLALNFFTPNFDFICETYGEPDTWTFTHEGESYRVTDVTDFIDEVEQVIASTRRVTNDGELVREAAFELALVSRRQFELLLEATGWSDWAVYGGFSGDELESTDQEMVWVVER